MTTTFAFHGLRRMSVLSLLVAILTAMLFSCRADAHQNIKRINMGKENLKEIYLAGGCFWGTEHYMKIVTFCIYITICFLIIGCKKSTSTIRDNAYDSVEKYETELEKLCLESHNGSVTYSIRIKTEDLTNDYEYKYLGSLKIKKNNFKVIQQKILSGQYQDSQRAAVSIRLFLKGKLYGEFTGLNNFYKIKITSNTLCLYNYETKSRSIFELKDSIPNLLFFPYNDKDSLSSGDIFYFNRCK